MENVAILYGHWKYKPFSLSYGHTIHFVIIGYIFPILLCCTKKNLATVPFNMCCCLNFDLFTILCYVSLYNSGFCPGAEYWKQEKIQYVYEALIVRFCYCTKGQHTYDDSDAYIVLLLACSKKPAGVMRKKYSLVAFFLDMFFKRKKNEVVVFVGVDWAKLFG
jgi:hypothetical protein